MIKKLDDRVCTKLMMKKSAHVAVHVFLIIANL